MIAFYLSSILYECVLCLANKPIQIVSKVKTIASVEHLSDCNSTFDQQPGNCLIDNTCK